MVVTLVDLDCGQGQESVVAEELLGGRGAGELFWDLLGHFLEQLLSSFEGETVRVDFILGQTVHSEVELTQLMQECLKQVPGHNGVEIHFSDFMGENGVIVFPTFLNTQQKVLHSIRILQLIKPGPVNQLIIQRLRSHIVFNFKLLLNHIQLREPVREFRPFINLVEIVVVQAINVERLGFVRLLVLDSLLELVHKVLDELLRVIGQGVGDQALLQAGGRLLDEEWDVDVLFLLEAGHFQWWSL